MSELEDQAERVRELLVSHFRGNKPDLGEAHNLICAILATVRRNDEATEAIVAAHRATADNIRKYAATVLDGDTDYDYCPTCLVVLSSFGECAQCDYREAPAWHQPGQLRPHDRYRRALELVASGRFNEDWPDWLPRHGTAHNAQAFAQAVLWPSFFNVESRPEAALESPETSIG